METQYSLNRTPFTRSICRFPDGDLIEMADVHDDTRRQPQAEPLISYQPSQDQRSAYFFKTLSYAQCAFQRATTSFRLGEDPTKIKNFALFRGLSRGRLEPNLFKCIIRLFPFNCDFLASLAEIKAMRSSSVSIDSSMETEHDETVSILLFFFATCGLEELNF